MLHRPKTPDAHGGPSDARASFRGLENRSLAVRIWCGEREKAGEPVAALELLRLSSYQTFRKGALEALGGPYDAKFTAPLSRVAFADPWKQLLHQDADWTAVDGRVVNGDDAWHACVRDFVEFEDERYDDAAVTEAESLAERAANDGGDGPVLDHVWEFCHSPKNRAGFGEKLAGALAFRVAKSWRNRWDAAPGALERGLRAAWRFAEAGGGSLLIDARALDALGVMLEHNGELDEAALGCLLGCLRELAETSLLTKALFGRHLRTLDIIARKHAERDADGDDADETRVGLQAMDCLWVGLRADYHGADDHRGDYAAHSALKTLASLVGQALADDADVALYGVACICFLAVDVDDGDAPRGLGGVDEALRACCDVADACLPGSEFGGDARRRGLGLRFATIGAAALARIRGLRKPPRAPAPADAFDAAGALGRLRGDLMDAKRSGRLAGDLVDDAVAATLGAGKARDVPQRLRSRPFPARFG